MGESLVQVTSGAGPKLHTWQRTVGANNVEDEFVIPGEYPLPTYTAQIVAASIATANDHPAQLMAGASLNVRVRRIRVEQAASVTTAAFGAFAVLRLTTAGTGGTAVTARPLNSADVAAGAAAMTTPTAKGTEGVDLFHRRLILTQTVSTAGGQIPSWEWVQSPNGEPLIIPAGATNGIVVKNLAAYAAGTIDVTFEFVETTF